MIINSVKVYAEDTEDRTIQVTTSSGEVIAEGTFLIPDGESIVDLNFEIPAGNNYEIKTTGNPMLYRNSTGSNLEYPYALGDMGAITGTNIEGQNEFNYYYFFYNWEVQRPITGCISERTEVMAIIDTTTSIDEADAASGIDVFPVPADEWVNIAFNFSGAYELTLFDIAGKVHHSEVNNTSVGSVATISTASLNTGLYFVRVVNNGTTMTKKVVLK